MPAAAPAAAPPSDEPRRRGILGLILKIVGLLVGAALLAGGGFVAGWFMFAQPASPVAEALKLIERAQPATEEADAAENPDMPRTPKATPEKPSFVTTYYTFADPLTTNLSNSRRYVQLTVALSTQYDAQVMTNVETHKVPLRSDMLAVIGGFTEEDLAGKEGRDRLAEALKVELNRRLETLEGFGGIEGVWFPSFVLQ